jgi:uncharacterized protein YbcI
VRGRKTYSRSYFFWKELCSSKKPAPEASISDTFVKFSRKLTGRGPADIRTEDMVLVRLKGILAIEETHLAKTDKGCKVVKEMRIVPCETYSEETGVLVGGMSGS